ncbi:MAG: glycoside hydrolase family 97 protein [Calditrichia bacterium]
MRFLMTFVLVAICLTTGWAEPLMVNSPNGVLAVSFELKNGEPFYSITRFERPVIESSRMGFVLRDARALNGSFRVIESELRNIDDTWTTVLGERKTVRNNFTELRVELEETTREKRRMTIRFRAFNDGVGFRYEIPKQRNLKSMNIMDELTEFALAGDHDSWWIGAYQWNRYEYLYSNTPLSEIDVVHTPFTMETKQGISLSIHEADLTNYSSMTLRRKGKHLLQADLVPWSDGIRVKTKAPMKTPWRTILITENPSELITSDLMLNLNEPNKIKDTSWIQPAKYVGIWWEMHLNVASWGSGDRHGATTANTKRYIDFAAEHGFDGVLVEGWNEGWDGDWVRDGHKFSFTKTYPDFDMPELSRYAAEKGTAIIGHHETGAGVLNYERQMNDAFKYYNKYGIKAIKTGYVQHGRNIKRIDENGDVQYESHHGQFMVEHYRKVIEEAAKYKLMINVHEPIKDTGIRRTWPNMVSREGARGQEYNAWGENGGNPPDHTTILPFTRLLGSPMDFTPGIFDLLFKEAKPANRVNTTLAKQLALYVVIYSPIQMAADLPQNYEANMPPFQFIKDVPADWQDTKVLHARIGDYVTLIRKDRASEEWYLGSITDQEGRVLRAPLTFLDESRQYVAQVYRDGDDADWQTNPYQLVIEEKLVNSQDELTLYLAPGGGQAIRFKPATDADIKRLQ